MSIFNSVLVNKPRRSAFNLSHEVKTSAKFGVLTPVLCQEVLPSDKWKISTESFTRFAPTLAPLMQRINTFEHYYFVPNRILWRGWERFISPSEKDDERPITPSLIFDGFGEDLPVSDYSDFKAALTVTSTVLDYLGINLRVLAGKSNQDFFNSGLEFSLLPIFAYNLIWLEYFADENQVAVREWRDRMLDFADLGQIKTSSLTEEQKEFIEWLITPKLRAWEKDYFTSALPNTQRGADITIGEANTLHLKANVDGAFVDSSTAFVDPSSTPPGGYGLGVLHLDGQETATQIYGNDGTAMSPAPEITIRGEVITPSVPVKDSETDADPVTNPVTINELRRAIKLQEFLEKSMRGGYRLIEQIKSHFGVTSSDARLDRPQFLGGDMQRVIVSELASTADTFNQETNSGSTLGEYSGRLTEVGNTKRRSFFSEEHGWIFCIFSCIPRTSYCQGLPRQFTRLDWLDYAWPEFAHLGEQEVKSKELYLTTSNLTNDKVFGYQSRYAEYKTIPSQIHGSFASNLSYWTMARRFSALPELSREFIEVQPNDSSITDAFTVTNAAEDYLFLNLYHKITCVRPLPKFGVPML